MPVEEGVVWERGAEKNEERKHESSTDAREHRKFLFFLKID